MGIPKLPPIIGRGAHLNSSGVAKTQKAFADEAARLAEEQADRQAAQTPLTGKARPKRTGDSRGTF